MILRQALRGAGYFQLTRHADKIASYFDRDEPFDDLREDALFAYALAMPGETTRGRIRGMLRKIDSIAHLSQHETELVMFALDERLRLDGLAPVFEADSRRNDHDMTKSRIPRPRSHRGRSSHKRPDATIPALRQRQEIQKMSRGVNCNLNS